MTFLNYVDMIVIYVAGVNSVTALEIDTKHLTPLWSFDEVGSNLQSLYVVACRLVLLYLLYMIVN